MNSWFKTVANTVLPYSNRSGLKKNLIDSDISSLRYRLAKCLHSDFLDNPICNPHKFSCSLCSDRAVPPLIYVFSQKCILGAINLHTPLWPCSESIARVEKKTETSFPGLKTIFWVFPDQICLDLQIGLSKKSLWGYFRGRYLRDEMSDFFLIFFKPLLFHQGKTVFATVLTQLFTWRRQVKRENKSI